MALNNCSHGDSAESISDPLNERVFHSIISKHFLTKPFKITCLENTMVGGAGENFLSTILRNLVRVELGDGTQRHFTFISKIGGSAMFDDAMVDAMQVFPKEIEAYINLVAEFEKIWKEADANDVCLFGPELYYHELEPHKILVFEDLNASEYKMANRLNGLTEQQVLLALEKISKWHAASRIFCSRRGSFEPLFKKGLFNSGAIGFLEPYYRLMYKDFMEMVSSAEIDPKHFEALKRWDGQLITNNLEILTVNHNEFNVLNHGDLWINNMMFKNEDDSTVLPDVKFIDFQLVYYGSPAVELLYFLVMSANHELLIDKFDEFIAFYHARLVDSLKRLNYNQHMPTLKELWIAVLKKSFYITLMLVTALPNLLLDHKRLGIDLSMAQRDDELGRQMRRKMFEHPIVVQALKRLIKYFGNRGMLDL